MTPLDAVNEVDGGCGVPTRRQITDAVQSSHLPPFARHVMLTLAATSWPQVGLLHPGQRIGIRDVVRWTGLARSTVAELVVALDLSGWISRGPTDRRGVACGSWTLHVGLPEIPRRAALKDATRQAVFDRDGHRCRSCGATQDLGVDHVVPWSRGGSDDPDNLQTLCRRCNASKGARV